MNPMTMWRTMEAYLCQLPDATHAMRRADDSEARVCRYTPHSLRSTTATLLRNAGVDITKVQELLGHRHVTTTRIYDKRQRSHAEDASHAVPL